MEEKDTLEMLPIGTELPNTVEGCHDLIRNLLQTVSGLFKRVEKLEIENKQMRERLNNNSSNSS